MPRKDLTSYTAKVQYRKHPGTIAWKFHRYSGVLLGLFLVFHMLGVSGICSFIGDVVKNPFLVGFMAILFTFHAANGIRIILMELCSSAERHKFLPNLKITFITAILVGACFAVKILI